MPGITKVIRTHYRQCLKCVDNRSQNIVFKIPLEIEKSINIQNTLY
jgi:hypothetical protein